MGRSPLNASRYFPLDLPSALIYAYRMAPRGSRNGGKAPSLYMMT